MVAMKIDDFAGLAPRVPPRMMGGASAQEYHNLLATAKEFRPLQGDRDVAPGLTGAQTLHRMTRDASGALRTDETQGWIAELRDKSYVRGQLNDDATERTAVSFNDGQDRPRVIDAKGADRLLGVPAPASVTVTLNEVGQFTREDALAWVSSDMIPAITKALSESLLEDPVQSRYYGGKPVAGSTSFFDLTPGTSHDPLELHLSFASVSLADVTKRGLSDPQLEGRDQGNTWRIPIELQPYWGCVRDKEALKNKLRAIESPKDGTAVFKDDQIDTLTDRLAALFDPDGDSIKAKRAEMDKAARAFVDSVTKDPKPSAGSKPVEPTKPTVPEYVWHGGEESGYARAQAWIDYDAAMTAYNNAMEQWRQSGAINASDMAAIVKTVHDAQNTAVSLSNEIEAEYFRRKGKIESLVTAMVNGMSLVGDGGLLDVDPDRIVESRFYIVTHVTDWGEESAPSKVSQMLTMDRNDSVTVTVAPPPSDRHIEKWRVYRSNAGTMNAAFQFVDELLVSTLTFTDTVKAEALGEPCQTITWAEPPYRWDEESAAVPRPPKGVDPYLKGLVAMPNGILAGFIDNYVAFCDPYHPYAWPVEYQITTEHPIVGLGVFGQTLFVGTLGYPYLISGSDSMSMSAQKLPFPQPCVSRRSIASAGAGVLYASPDGICLASGAGVQVVTAPLFAREDWQAMNPQDIWAVVHEDVYYFWANDACWALDFAAQKLGTVGDLTGVTALERDVLTDGLFAVKGDRVHRLFAQGRRAGAWKSGVQVLPQQAPLAWVQVDGDQGQTAPLTLEWWGDGQLRHTAPITDIQPKRLPPGRWLEHEVRISGAARITKVLVASSSDELRGA